MSDPQTQTDYYPVLTSEGAQKLVNRLLTDEATLEERVSAVLRISVSREELPELCHVLGLAFHDDPPAFVSLDAIKGLEPEEWNALEHRWATIAEGRYVYVDDAASA